MCVCWVCVCVCVCVYLCTCVHVSMCVFLCVAVSVRFVCFAYVCVLFVNVCLHACFCISVPPTVTLPNDILINVNKNTPLTLTCTGSGKPLPLLTWSRNGRPLASFNEDWSYETQQGSRSLNYTIASAGDSDSGWYTCTADSPTLGMQYSSSKKVYINVQGGLEMEQAQFVWRQ